jgi:hypothetical protein
MLKPINMSKLLSSSMNIKVYKNNDSVTIHRDDIKKIVDAYNNNIILHNKLVSKNNNKSVSNEYIDRFYLKPDDIADLMRIIADKKYNKKYNESDKSVNKALLKYNSLLQKIESKLKYGKNKHLTIDDIKSSNTFFDNKYLESLLKQL